MITFSAHFKRSLAAIGVLIALLLGAYFWIKTHIREMLMPPNIALPINDKELVTYSETRHILTITTAKGTTSQYSRNPNVEIRKDGTVKVDAHAWGAEVRPFLGVGRSDTWRVYAGCQLFYFHQWDAAASFGFTGDGSRPALQPMLSLGYNVWSNTSINAGVNPVPFVLQQKPQYAILLSVRL